MEGWTLTALGFVAGTSTTFSLVPQVLKAWRATDPEAISKRTYAISTCAYGLWIVHGLMIASLPIIVFNAVALLLGGAILALKLRARRGAGPPVGQEPALFGAGSGPKLNAHLAC